MVSMSDVHALPSSCFMCRPPHRSPCQKHQQLLPHHRLFLMICRRSCFLRHRWWQLLPCQNHHMQLHSSTPLHHRRMQLLAHQYQQAPHHSSTPLHHRRMSLLPHQQYQQAPHHSSTLLHHRRISLLPWSLPQTQILFLKQKYGDVLRRLGAGRACPHSLWSPKVATPSSQWWS